MASLVVVKRNGEKESFNLEKIKQAILLATVDKESDKIDEVLNNAINIINDRFKENVHIYEIQSIVEKLLMENKLEETAGRYISYRINKDMERYNLLNANKNIQQLLDKDPSVVNENANKDSRVFNTMRDLTAGSVAKAYAKKVMPKELYKAHVSGDVHFHDMDHFPYLPETNCNLVNYSDVFENGFSINGTKVTTPQSIDVACSQIVLIIASVSSQSYGGQTINNIDQLLAPYAEKNYQKHYEDAKQWIENEEKWDSYAKNKTQKDIFKALEGLEYDINSLTTSSSQIPFVSVSFGLGTNWFEREIQKTVLQVRLNGIGTSKITAIFPKLLFILKEGINLNKEDPNYDIKQLAMKCTAQRIYPDYLNFDKIVEICGGFRAPMGCRSFLQTWKDENNNEVNDGRGNAGVQTINLVRVAIESKGDFDIFWEILDKRLDIAHKMAQFRIEYLKNNLVPEMAPILYKQGVLGRLEDNDKEVFNKIFGNKRGTISIGYIGLHEVATLMYGKDWQDNIEAKQFTIDILKYMKKHTDEWGNEEGIHYSVYGSPSESLTDKLARLDKQRFGIIEGITDKDYYINSFHYDVEKEISPFAKIDFEAEYLPYTSGGFINYVEMPSLKNNIEAMEAIINYGYTKVGYLGINSPIDKCFECQFEGDFTATENGYVCPSCGNHDKNKMQVVKRLCGYLGEPNIRPIVKGRYKEIASRVKHSK